MQKYVNERSSGGGVWRLFEAEVFRDDKTSPCGRRGKHIKDHVIKLIPSENRSKVACLALCLHVTTVKLAARKLLPPTQTVFELRHMFLAHEIWKDCVTKQRTSALVLAIFYRSKCVIGNRIGGSLGVVRCRSKQILKCTWVFSFYFTLSCLPGRFITQSYSVKLRRYDGTCTFFLLAHSCVP